MGYLALLMKCTQPVGSNANYKVIVGKCNEFWQDLPKGLVVIGPFPGLLEVEVVCLSLWEGVC